MCCISLLFFVIYVVVVPQARFLAVANGAQVYVGGLALRAEVKFLKSQHGTQFAVENDCRADF